MSWQIYIYVTQSTWHSLCPRYTGEIPATYAGPGQLGSEGLPHGKCAWVTQAVNKPLKVESLLILNIYFNSILSLVQHTRIHQTS